MVPSWFVSAREAGAVYAFRQDVARCMTGRIQLTSDGHRTSLESVSAPKPTVSWVNLIPPFSPPAMSNGTPSLCASTGDAPGG